jgi:hypothetical protein
VTRQDIGFADSVISKESIGSLRIRPVLARPWSRCPHPARQLLQQLSQSLAMANIRKLASHNLIVYPRIRFCSIHRSSAIDGTRPLPRFHVLLSHELVIPASNGLEAEYLTSISKTVQLVGN